jgi:hypothetical protein
MTRERVPPTPVRLLGRDERDALADELREDIAIIDLQLQSKTGEKPDGTRYTPEEFEAWKKRAVFAKKSKELDIMRIKRLNATADREFLRAMRATHDGYNPHDAGDLLAASYDTIRDLTADEAVTDDPDAFALLDDIKTFLSKPTPLAMSAQTA